MIEFSNLPDRIKANTYIDPTTNCWLWMGAASSKNGLRYGNISIGGKARSTHRVVYEMLIGPIPEDKEIDHLCKNTKCCNPSHLEAVIHKENIRRGNAGKYQTLKTHCPQGHEYTLENTYIFERQRTCRICNRAKGRRHYLKKWDGKRGPKNADKTHCKFGHEFTPENIYMYKGSRYCRICRHKRNWPRPHVCGLGAR